MRVTNNGNTEKSRSHRLIYDFPHFFQQYHTAALNQLMLFLIANIL